MVNLERQSLRGQVEVDETWIAGTQAGLRGSRQLKTGTLHWSLWPWKNAVGRPGALGWLWLPDFKSTTLLAFLKQNVVPGSTIYTDGLKSFAGLQEAGFEHVARPQLLRIDLRRTPTHVLCADTGRRGSFSAVEISKSYLHWFVQRVAFQVPPELFPVEHRFIDVDGKWVHYIDEGTGETLLFLHGNPSWCFLYRKIIASLKPSYRCVALDFPGYGMSVAPAGYGYTPQEHATVLERFVDRLDLRHLTIMVHDWGGPIGLGFAGRRPDLVHRLIIGNTFAWPLDGECRMQIFSWVMGGPIGRALTSAFNFVPRVFFARGLAKRPSPKVLRIYFVPWQDRKRRVAAVIAPRQLIAASPYLRTVEQNLPKLADRPVLIVWGMKDFAFCDAERVHFERVFPKHKTIKLSNASHFLQEDAGEQIAEEIKVFLNEST